VTTPGYDADDDVNNKPSTLLLALELAVDAVAEDVVVDILRLNAEVNGCALCLRPTTSNSSSLVWELEQVAELRGGT
jgi:hypothetical protein